MYDFWQFLHVTSAIVWVGANVLVVFLSFRFAALPDNPIAGPATGLIAKTAVPLFMVASLTTLLTGLIMAFGWTGFEPLWIKIGLGGIIVSLVMGFGYHKPHGAKLEAAMRERGPGDPGVRALVRQANTVSVIEVLILVIVIWAMVVKP